MDKIALFTGLQQALLPFGFSRKSSSWYLDEGTLLKVIHLQRSSYSALYYVNLGIYFKTLGSEKYPKQHHCHLTMRMANHVVGSTVDYEYLFDLEHLAISVEELHAALIHCVKDVLLLQLGLMTSKEGLLMIARDTPAILNMIPLRTKAFLGMH